MNPGDRFQVSGEIATALYARLPSVAEEIFDAVVTQLPVFADPFRGELGRTVEAAINTALTGFLALVSPPDPGRAAIDMAVVQQAAFDLGRGEARSGRTMDSLNAAYRLGARIGWRNWSSAAEVHGISTADLARFAELNFDFIDNLADASASGHATELASASRLRQRRREQLVAHLLAGAPADVITAAADLAGWRIPDQLVAVVLPRAEARHAAPLFEESALPVGEDLLSAHAEARFAGLLVPITAALPRPAVLTRLAGLDAAVGPQRSWRDVRRSADLATRARRHVRTDVRPIDADCHLTDLVLRADPETRAAQHESALRAFDGLRPATRARYEETLRAWLLHQGRREDVARRLFLHPQTVRYRMDRIRELLGDDLTDPDRVLEIIVALA